MDFLFNDFIFQESEMNKILNCEEMEENLEVRNDETQM